MAVIPVGDAAEATALDLLQALRHAGIIAEIAYRGNLKRRMERANKIGAGAAVILGEDEIAEGAAMVKNLDQGTQQRVPLDELVRALAETGLVETRSRRCWPGCSRRTIEDDEDGAEEPGARRASPTSSTAS